MSTIVYDDFAGAWPTDKWYRHLPIPDLWDPVAYVTCPGNGTLALQAQPLTLTRHDPHDNVKALIYSTAEFAPGERGMMTVAADMRVATFGTERNPFGADAGDGSIVPLHDQRRNGRATRQSRAAMSL